jgi:hypothetical protein
MIVVYIALGIVFAYLLLLLADKIWWKARYWDWQAILVGIIATFLFGLVILYLAILLTL